MIYPIPDSPPLPCFQLDETTIIGRGNKRDCHAHPNDPRRCIKVARHLDRWVECQEQTIVEWYYTSFLKRRDIPLRHAADCYGWANTSYGPGLVLERVRNNDGSPALTLRNAIEQRTISLEDADHMLDELKQWAISHSVVIADLNTDNLMVRWKNGLAHLVIIDGLGSRRADWKFTLYQKLPWLARFKTQRQWERQEISLFDTLHEIAHSKSR